jgi:electron transport complex protein RnfD
VQGVGQSKEVKGWRMAETNAKGEEKQTEAKKLLVTVPPHIWKGESTQQIMLWVIGALLPVTLYAIWVFKLHALIVIVLSVGTCVATELGWQKIQKLPVTINDFSAVLTGLLLALVLPPLLPWWMVVIGGFVAIMLGKLIFGGLGYNIFNPALVGRAVLVLSWTQYMTTRWYEPLVSKAGYKLLGITAKIDAMTSATPLFAMKQVQEGALKGVEPSSFYKALLFSNPGGSIGEVSALLLLIGAAVLLWKKIIDWRIPFYYLLTVAVLTVLLGKDPLFYLLAGGLILGAFFMATDYVTSCITRNGRIIFGVGLGVFTVLLRFYSNLPEAVMVSILFMNCCVPLIDRYTRPKIYGAVRAGE